MHMNRYLLIPAAVAVTLALGLTACTAVKAETPQQRYFALKQDYVTALTAASVYSDNCRAKPTKHCVKVVKQAQAADSAIASVIKVADKVAVTLKTDPSVTDEEKLLGYIDSIALSVEVLRTYSIQ